jgi:hypothetical protein
MRGHHVISAEEPRYIFAYTTRSQGSQDVLRKARESGPVSALVRKIHPWKWYELLLAGLWFFGL